MENQAPIMVVIAVRVVEGLFALGLLGSIAVVLLTGIEDVRTLVGREEKHPPK